MRSLLRIVIVTIPVLFILGIISVLMFKNHQPEPKRPTDPWSGARGACMLQLERVLHDPRSAEFGLTSDWPLRVVDADTAEVRATYRAKNKFGALVLSSSTCTVKKVEGGFRVAVQ